MKISLIFISVFVLFNVLAPISAKYLLIDVGGNDLDSPPSTRKNLPPNLNGSPMKPGMSFRKEKKEKKKRRATSAPQKVTSAPEDCTKAGEKFGKVISKIEEMIFSLFGKFFDPYPLDGVPIAESLKKLGLENGKIMGFKTLKLNDTCVTEKDKKTRIKEIRTTLWIKKLQLTYDVGALDSKLDATIRDVNIQMVLPFESGKLLKKLNPEFKRLKKFDIIQKEIVDYEDEVLQHIASHYDIHKKWTVIDDDGIVIRKNKGKTDEGWITKQLKGLLKAGANAALPFLARQAALWFVKAPEEAMNKMISDMVENKKLFDLIQDFKG